MSLTTVFITVLFCIVCNGGYSGWVLSACPIFKSVHHHLTFGISSECIKFNGHMTSSYQDICMKVTPQSIWIHCSVLNVMARKSNRNIIPKCRNEYDLCCVAKGFLMGIVELSLGVLYWMPQPVGTRQYAMLQVCDHIEQHWLNSLTFRKELHWAWQGDDEHFCLYGFQWKLFWK